MPDPTPTAVLADPVDDELLWDTILAESSAPNGQAPRGDQFVDPRNALWQRGDPTPMSSAHRVFALFDVGDSDVAVYAVPVGKDYPPDGFKRFLVQRKGVQAGAGTKVSASCLVTSMSAEVFVREVGDELWASWEISTGFERKIAGAETMAALLREIVEGKLTKEPAVLEFLQDRARLALDEYGGEG